MTRTLTPSQMAAALGVLAKDKEWRKELRKANRQAPLIAVRHARSRMRSGSDRQLAAAAAAVKAGSNATAGYVRVSGRVKTSTKPMSALAPVWGTKKRTGWFADERYDGSSKRNNPKWVGNDWKVGGPDGPRGVNPAIADAEGEIMDAFVEAASSLIDRAFPR
jgi:hypothetical protein